MEASGCYMHEKEKLKDLHSTRTLFFCSHLSSIRYFHTIHTCKLIKFHALRKYVVYKCSRGAPRFKQLSFWCFCGLFFLQQSRAISRSFAQSALSLTVFWVLLFFFNFSLAYGFYLQQILHELCKELLACAHRALSTHTSSISISEPNSQQVTELLLLMWSVVAAAAACRCYFYRFIFSHLFTCRFSLSFTHAMNWHNFNK